MESDIQRKVIIGACVGLGSMIVVSLVVVIVLYQLQRCRDNDEEEEENTERKAYKIPRPRRGSNATSFNTSGVLSDPSPLRSLRFDSLNAMVTQPLNVAQLPLHQAINDPFHTSSQDRRQPLAPRNSGTIALTPFRESSLPGARIQLNDDGSFVPDSSDNEEEERKKSTEKRNSYGNTLEVNPLYSYKNGNGSSRESTASDIIDMLVDGGIRPPPIGYHKTSYTTKLGGRNDWERSSLSSNEDYFDKAQQHRSYLDRVLPLQSQEKNLAQEKMKRILEYQRQQSAASSSGGSNAVKTYKKSTSTSSTNVKYKKRNAPLTFNQGRIYERQESSGQQTTSSIPGYSVPQSHVTDVYRSRTQNSFQQSMPTNKHFVWTDADDSSVGTPICTSSEEDFDTGIDTWGEERQKSLQDFDYTRYGKIPRLNVAFR